MLGLFALVTDTISNVIFISILFLFVRLDLLPGLFLFLLFFLWSLLLLLFFLILIIRLYLGKFDLDMRHDKFDGPV